MRSFLRPVIFVLLLAVVCLTGTGCMRQSAAVKFLRPAPEALALLPDARTIQRTDSSGWAAAGDSVTHGVAGANSVTEKRSGSLSQSSTARLKTGLPAPGPRHAAARKIPRLRDCIGPPVADPAPGTRNPSLAIWRAMSISMVFLSMILLLAFIEESENSLFIVGGYLLACLFGMSITSDGDFTLASFVVIVLFQIFVMMTLSFFLPEIFLLPTWLENSAGWLALVSFILYLVGMFVPIRRRPSPGGRPLEKRAWKKALNKLLGAALVSLLVALTAGGFGIYMALEELTILGFAALAFMVVCLLLSFATVMRK